MDNNNNILKEQEVNSKEELQQLVLYTLKNVYLLRKILSFIPQCTDYYTHCRDKGMKRAVYYQTKVDELLRKGRVDKRLGVFSDVDGYRYFSYTGIFKYGHITNVQWLLNNGNTELCKYMIEKDFKKLSFKTSSKITLTHSIMRKLTVDQIKICAKRVPYLFNHPSIADYACISGSIDLVQWFQNPSNWNSPATIKENHEYRQKVNQEKDKLQKQQEHANSQSRLHGIAMHVKPTKPSLQHLPQAPTKNAKTGFEIPEQYKLSKIGIQFCAQFGHIELMKRLHGGECKSFFSNSLMAEAIPQGQIQVLEYLLSLGFSFTQNLMDIAIGYKDSNSIQQYLLKHPKAFSKWVYDYKFGHR